MPAAWIPLFEPAGPPAAQARLAINRHASWWTWSSEARHVFRSWSDAGLKFPSPVLTELPGDRAYPYTYSIRRATLPSALRKDLLLLARGLCRVRPGRRLMLFDALFDRYLDSDALQFLFAGLRSTLVDLSGDRLASLHVPLDRGDRSNFPLHADLFPPPILLNVFDGVAAGNRGASIFLDTSILIRRLPEIAEMPARVRRRIARMLREEVTGDLYNEFYNLLHGDEHAWTPGVERLMREERLQVKMRRGQGYLIDDRRWLHGRLAVPGRVGRRRLQRLLYRPVLR